MKKQKLSTFERLKRGQLNRSQRRSLARQVAASDPGLTVVNANAAGIDVGNGSHFVAVPPDRDADPVREFGCWTEALRQMAEWLVACRIDTVAMQSTGVYWIALYDMLEQHGLRVVLVNAEHSRNVPGRKTDVQECQWLMKLHCYGLLRNSFRLPAQIEGVRTIWRLRSRHVEEAGRSIQHMQKALTKMNVQLANAISDLSGLTGQRILAAILSGERDPHQLAELRDPRIQASPEEVARSLEGNWREDVLFELQQARDAYQFAQRQIQECDRKLATYLAALPTRPLAPAPPRDGARSGGSGKGGRKSRKRGNEPQLPDLKEELTRICGVDLTSIDGISTISALTILSEIGTDMSGFPNENEFASWLGLTRNDNRSGGKPVRGPKRKVKNRVAAVLRMGATSLLNSHSYLGARYRHLRRKAKGPAVAVKAMARYLAVLVYRLMTKGQAWVDEGEARFERKRDQREMAALEAQARARGLQLVPFSATH
jgi:transposase